MALDHFLKIKEQLSNVVIVSPDAGGVARSVYFIFMLTNQIIQSQEVSRTFKILWKLRPW